MMNVAPHMVENKLADQNEGEVRQTIPKVWIYRKSDISS